jgi:hypothetical protein
MPRLLRMSDLQIICLQSSTAHTTYHYYRVACGLVPPAQSSTGSTLGRRRHADATPPTSSSPIGPPSPCPIPDSDSGCRPGTPLPRPIGRLDHSRPRWRSGGQEQEPFLLRSRLRWLGEATVTPLSTTILQPAFWLLLGSSVHAS